MKKLFLLAALLPFNALCMENPNVLRQKKVTFKNLPVTRVNKEETAEEKRDWQEEKECCMFCVGIVSTGLLTALWYSLDGTPLK